MNEVEMTFIYETIPEKIKCRKDEIIQDILERFADTKDKNAENFIFLFEGKKVDGDCELDEIFRGKYEKPILVYDLEMTTVIDNNEINEITIIYLIEKDKNYLMRIFGDKFVENNKKVCKITIKGKEQELCS